MLWHCGSRSPPHCGIYKHKKPIASCIHRRHTLQTLRDDVQASPPTDLDRLFNKVNRRFAVPTMSEELCLAAVRIIKETPLYQDQYVALCEIMDEKKPRLVLNGRAGTGKTTTIRLAVNLLCYQGKRVLVTASTGKAAQNLKLGAYTLHFGLDLGISNQLKPIGSQELTTFMTMMDHLFADECSMISTMTIKPADDRLLSTAPSSVYVQRLPFGGRRVTLSGDIHQLPLVCINCKIIVGPCAHNIYHSEFWRHAHHLTLTQSAIL